MPWFHRFRRSAPTLGVLLLTLGASLDLRAIDINWRSTVGASNFTSAGPPSEIGEGFMFELGAFADGFEPNPENKAEWASRWVALDRASYNAANRFFASKASLTSNAEPFQIGGRGYIWGFNLETPGEWILITNVQWTWPSAAGGIQPPLSWGVAESGNTAIVGAVNGGGFHMMTASAGTGSPPDVNPEAWQQQFFNAGERSDPAISGWEADPDLDGACNLVELAAGTNPRDPGSQPQLSSRIVEAPSGLVVIQLSLARTNRASLTHAAELSSGLEAWSESGVVLVSDTPQELVFESPPSSEPSQFLRMKLCL